MEKNHLSIKPIETLSLNDSSISFTNPDGSKVNIGKNDCKNVQIKSKDGVLWVKEIK